MTISIVNKDILQIDMNKYMIAHCISGDFTLGAGLAKKINEKYDMCNKLKDRFQYENGKYGAYLIDGIFNLVTKDTYKDKSTYDGLKKALEDMKVNLYYLNIKNIAIPKLGCGKDKLEWNVVEGMLHDVFDDMDINIEVCVL